MKISLPAGVTLYHGDCRESLRLLPDNSIDAVPCDPPYELTQATRHVPPPVGAGPYGRHRVGVNGDNRPVGGFMGKEWDGTGIAHDPEFWAEVYRVLKPGGHLAAFSASRTYHRMACAIEDAGFEIRDSLMWIYGTGFPKSQNVAKFIDTALGAQGEKIATGAAVKRMIPGADQNKDGWIKDDGREFVPHEYAPGSPAAIEFDGFGTALKPAFEPIVLARKPLSEPTVAANVLKWRTGALNIDGCRVGTEGGTKGCDAGPSNGILGNGLNGSFGKPVPGLGRWPANVVTDGSDEVVGMFPTTKGDRPHARGGKNPNPMDWGNARADGHIVTGRAEPDGSAARFFYSAKASKADRAGSKHPTVKPISLMQWLARLITPPGGTVLDPFAGSGTTGAAAVAEGFSAILCERENEYVADIKRRLGAGDDLDAALRADHEARRLLRELLAA
jgi:DNA modification methylase